MLLSNRDLLDKKFRDKANLSDILHKSHHILIIKLRYIGDTVWLLPFLENLRLNFPNAILSVIVNEGTETFISNASFVDNTIVFPRKEVKYKWGGFFKFLSFIKSIRKSKPDVVIDLTDSDRAALISYLVKAKLRIGITNPNVLRSRLFTHLFWMDNANFFRYKCGSNRHLAGLNLDLLRVMGLSIFSDTINLAVDKSAGHALRDKFPEIFINTDKRSILIHPGARVALRQWGTRNYAKLCDLLTDNYRVMLAAGSDEKHLLIEICNKMEKMPYICIDSLTLDEFVVLCENSDLFIGNDSGPIHIAATRVFTVGIYGPNISEVSGPWSTKKYIFENKNLYCRPCRQTECSHEIFKYCMESIQPEEIAAKINSLFNYELQFVNFKVVL